jgi:hypothetical protein
MTLFFPLPSDRQLAPEHVQARWRQAFAYANRTNAIEGLPPPSALGRQVQEWIAQGLLTVDEGVAMLVRHHTGQAQA